MHTPSLWCVSSRSDLAREHWLCQHATDVKETRGTGDTTRLHPRKGSMTASAKDSPQSPRYGDPHSSTDPHMLGMQIERHQLSSSKIPLQPVCHKKKTQKH